MIVIAIMACALFGTIIMIGLCGCARWSLIYLIRYRIIKCEVKNPHYELSGKKDLIAIIVAVISLIVAALLLIYGVPFLIEHFSELPTLNSH